MPKTRVCFLFGISITAAWMVAASAVHGQDQPPVQDVEDQSVVEDQGVIEDQGIVANVLSRLLTTPTTRIGIGAIDGVLSTSAVIHDITIADPDGVWLTLGRAELDWSLTALLRRRLQVSELTLDGLTITRRPLPTDRPEEVTEGTVFPELPVELIVENFTLHRLVLEEPVLGTAAELSATGSAQLVSPEEGLQIEFAGRRLDAEGSLDVALRYLPETNVLSLNLDHDEPEGGIVARLLDLPGLPPVQLQLSGDAPLENFVADLNFQAGPTIGAQGAARVNREADAYRLDLDVGAQIDGLLGPQVAVSGAVRTMRDGFAFDALRLEGANLDVTTDGVATQESADLEVVASIPRLAELHERLDGGRARIVGRLTGSLERPNAVVTATFEDVQAMDREIPRFVIDVGAQDILGAIDASLSLDGEVGGNPAAGGFRLQAVDDGWSLDPLDITVGSVALDGNLFVGPDLLTQGAVNLRAGELDDLSPLLLIDLAGQFDLSANLSVNDGSQHAVLKASAPEVSVAEILIRDFRLDATGQDVLAQPRIDGVAEAGMINFAGQSFTEVRVSAEGTPEATNFSLSAIGDGAVFETDGRLMPPPPGDTMPRLDLEDIRLRPVDP